LKGCSRRTGNPEPHSRSFAGLKVLAVTVLQPSVFSIFLYLRSNLSGFLFVSMDAVPAEKKTRLVEIGLRSL